MPKVDMLGVMPALMLMPRWLTWSHLRMGQSVKGWEFANDLLQLRIFSGKVQLGPCGVELPLIMISPLGEESVINPSNQIPGDNKRWGDAVSIGFLFMAKTSQNCGS